MRGEVFLKKVTIQAYEDRSRAEGGHAVILLQGLTEPKGLVAFRVRPLDSQRGSDGNGGWIGGEHLPVSVAATDYGLEIVAGPDVTESELLLPGTVVEIQIPSSGVRGEFLWPNIAPVMRPKRRNIAIVKPRSQPRPVETVTAETATVATATALAPDAAPAVHVSLPEMPAPVTPAIVKEEVAVSPAVPSTTSPEREQAAVATSTEAQVATPAPMEATPGKAESFDFPYPTAPVSTAPTEAPKAPIPMLSRDARGLSSKSAPGSLSPPPAAEAPATAAASAPEDLEPSEPATIAAKSEEPVTRPGKALTPEDEELEREIGEKYGWAFKKDLNVLMSKKFFALGASRHDDVQEEAVRTAHRSEHHSIAAEATAILAHHEADHTAAPVTEYQPEKNSLGVASKPYTGGYAGAYDEAAANEPAYRPDPRPAYAAPESRGMGRSVPSERPAGGIDKGMAAALAALVAAGVAGLAILWSSAQKPTDIPHNTAGGLSPSLTAALAVPPSPPSSDAIYQAIAPGGATSPRGVSAAGVSLDKALENATRQLLSTGGQRDTEEGAFWLKQFISGTIGDSRTIRVVTQLGSIYAEPATGTPDYAKSRLLWEIAGAAGDPVAMCFLGLLHENGLGVAVDKQSALQWYERSKEKGGCPSIDESLARLRK